MPCSCTRLRHNCTVGRLTFSSAAIATLSCPARARKIIRQRSATCCGVPCEASHCSICVRSAASNLIARLRFGITKIIAIADKSVKLFMRHYTSSVVKALAIGSPSGQQAGLQSLPRAGEALENGVVGVGGKQVAELLLHALDACPQDAQL